MSLIIDMLKDLDGRRYQPGGVATAARQAAWPSDSRTRGQLTGRALALGGAGLLIAGVLAGIALHTTAPVQFTQATGATRPAAVDSHTAGMQTAGRDANAVTVPAVQPDTLPAPGAVTVTTEPGSEARVNGAPARSPVAAAPAARAGKPVMETPAGIEVTPRPLSPEQQLARDFHAASTALSNGNIAEAEHLLEDLLTRDNAQHRARLLLAGLYVQQQQPGRAESVLASGLLHYPQHAPYARLYAQLLAAQARDSEAIHALQTALPAAGDDAGYLALLAGLYQRNGKAAAAVSTYRAALRLAPAHGEWWTGLGISSEQAGDAQTAAAAYREAIRHPLTAALQQYVQQRLKLLASG